MVKTHKGPYGGGSPDGTGAVSGRNDKQALGWLKLTQGLTCC